MKRRPSVLPSSLAQAITEDFYGWELRGRGWALGDSRIQLEPPFRPCTFRHRVGEIVDDGRVAPLWKRIAASLKRPARDLAPTDGLVLDDERRLLSGHPPKRTFFHISFPESVKLSKEVTQRLLASIAYCSAPLAMEFVGRGNLRCQLAVAEQDAPMVEPLLRSFMPDATITVGADLVAASVHDGAHRAMVDFGLSDEFMLPIGMPTRFDPHPLTAVLAALGSLSADERGAVQVLFAPAHAAWAPEMTRAVAGPSGAGVFEDAPWMTARCQEKVEHSLFAVAMRLCVWASGAEGARSLARSATSGLQTFAAPQGNAFIPLTNDLPRRRPRKRFPRPRRKAYRHASQFR